MVYDDFVGIEPNAYSAEFCQKAIAYYDAMAQAGFAYDRQAIDDASKVTKDDSAVFCTSTVREMLAIKAPTDLFNEFNQLFWGTYYKTYMQEYGVLQDVSAQAAPAFKIQKTQIGGGYHVWHFEDGNRQFASRILAWMVYLNDVEQGGETEFLYQHKRYRPTAGTLLIWPAGFTHTHRGNPPLSNAKYVITGWVEL
ncbi:MAG: 2OG-Fe(II) oxygenase [Myxococcales bacterium]|nr:2OG-Fe(II) oxygenase [Myxococcales bacterium]